MSTSIRRKCEVRFQDSQRLYRQLLSTLRTRFLRIDVGAGHQLATGSAASDAAPTSPNPAEQRLAQQELANWAQEQLAGWQPNTDLSDLEARWIEPVSAPGMRPVFGTGNVIGEEADVPWAVNAVRGEHSLSDSGRAQAESTSGGSVPSSAIQHVGTAAAAARIRPRPMPKSGRCKSTIAISSSRRHQG